MGNYSVRGRVAATVAGFGGLLLVVCLVAPLVGSTPISLARAFDRSIPYADNVDAQIFFVARLPRVVAGALVGAALATAGAVLQALFRNPLAAPETLGVSAGAALGAILAITFASEARFGPLAPVPLASLVGALSAMTVVYLLARSTRRPLSTSVLLLAGVALNAFISAMILFVQYLADFTQTYRAVRWLIGDLDVGAMGPIVASLPVLLSAALLILWLPSALNLLSVDADAAAARGVHVIRVQRMAFVGASLATAAAVSLSGPVAFVGIIVPHLVRLVVGVDHRVVLPAAALFGATFLVLCDLVARTLLNPVELPVGIVTAILGGPFFLWLLVRKR